MRRPVRQHGETGGKRDLDRFEQATLIRAATWSLPGAAVGVLAAGAASALGGWSLPAALLLGVAIWAATFAAPLVAAAAGGKAAGSLYNPTGRSTPRKREYSHAESLVARGLYEEAVQAFEVAIAEDPTDPEPYLRIARIQRDHLGRYEDAAAGFTRALSQPGLPAGLRLLGTRELMELYAGKLGQPARAAPLLARFAEEHEGTPEGDWAAGELRRVKETLSE